MINDDHHEDAQLDHHLAVKEKRIAHSKKVRESGAF